MVNLFGIIFFLSLIFLITGLIRPKIFKFIPTRKILLLIGLSLIIISLVGIVIFSPKEVKKENVKIVANNIGKRPAEIIGSTTEKTSISLKPEKKYLTAKIVPAVKNATSTNIFYPVIKIVDGDTIKITMNGQEETIRLLGIDTPEIVDPRKPIQCFGLESSNEAKLLLSGRMVRLETDSSQSEKDIYGRFLAYVYRDDGLFYNKYMIEQGYAREYTFITPYKYQTDFKAEQKLAEENKRGLWSPDTCNGTLVSVIKN